MNLAKLFSTIQNIMPQHGLSRLVGKLADTKIKIIKNTFIKVFIKKYKVDLSSAIETNPENFENFNQFFTRALKPKVRPISTSSIVSPADGCISQIGNLENNKILQAKGRDYTVEKLLGFDKKWCDKFTNGLFSTIYLAPKDYHRVHMPIDGELISMSYVPGKLFSVNKQTSLDIPDLFARNERLICYFNTLAGPMALILVGAMIVAGIETVWEGHIAPNKNKKILHWNYQNSPEKITLSKGQEMGRFKLGSTVILLFGQNKINWNTRLDTDSILQMGQSLGDVMDE